MNRAFPFLMMAALLGGCAAHQARICEREGPVHLGETAYVDGPSVRPDKLLEDSRCPIGLQCVQAGQVRIAATVIGGSGKEDVELTLGKPLQVADGTITLLSVLPQKRADQQIGPASYRFTFSFKGGL
ncbi:MAG: hypothetical protein QM690_17590 [Sphingobium sp.]